MAAGAVLRGDGPRWPGRLSALVAACPRGPAVAESRSRGPARHGQPRGHEDGRDGAGQSRQPFSGDSWHQRAVRLVVHPVRDKTHASGTAGTTPAAGGCRRVQLQHSASSLCGGLRGPATGTGRPRTVPAIGGGKVRGVLSMPGVTIQARRRALLPPAAAFVAWRFVADVPPFGPQQARRHGPGRCLWR